MPIVFPSNNSQAVGSNVPDQAIDASEFSRVEPLITPDQLKSRHLFGIPMVSPIVDPITKKPAIMGPEIIKDNIIRAVSRIEFELGINIFPVQHEIRAAFDRHEYLAYGYMQLPHRPVLSVQEVSITTPTGSSVYSVPLEWVSPGHLQRGQLNLVPLQAAFLSSGTVPSQGGNGQAFISILGQSGWVPEYWKVRYVAGFDEGKLPRVMNELIGIYAAIEILSQLQSLNRVSSHSAGIDGYSQSVSTPGPQVYQPRIDRLEEDKKTLCAKVKALFQGKFLASSL